MWRDETREIDRYRCTDRREWKRVVGKRSGKVKFTRERDLVLYQLFRVVKVVRRGSSKRTDLGEEAEYAGRLKLFSRLRLHPAWHSSQRVFGSPGRHLKTPLNTLSWTCLWYCIFQSTGKNMCTCIHALTTTCLWFKVFIRYISEVIFTATHKSYKLWVRNPSACCLCPMHITSQDMWRKEFLFSDYMERPMNYVNTKGADRTVWAK